VSANRSAAGWATALVAGTLWMVSACAMAVPGSPVTVGGPPVDLTLLDVGNYPTRPRPSLGIAGTPLAGALIDGQRMANYVVGPWEIDPTLTGRYAMGALLLTSPDELSVLGPAELAIASGRHNFINGFVSARQDSGRKRLLNTVLRFAEASDAEATLTELEQTTSNESEPVQRVVIPGYPDARAFSDTVIDTDTNRQWTAVRSFASHGPYILIQLAESADGIATASALVANTVERQRLVINQFQATDPLAFPDIELDPSGLLARTLPMPPDEATVVQNARFGKRGALHFQNDPVRFTALFDRTVMDLAAMAKTNVYRSADDESAIRIVHEFAADALATGGKPVDGVEFLPASRCLQFEDEFYCVAPADRYAIEARSRGIDDARQQVAAQYTLLVAA